MKVIPGGRSHLQEEDLLIFNPESFRRVDSPADGHRGALLVRVGVSDLSSVSSSVVSLSNGGGVIRSCMEVDLKDASSAAPAGLMQPGVPHLHET